MEAGGAPVLPAEEDSSIPITEVFTVPGDPVDNDELAALANPERTDFTNWPAHMPIFLAQDTIPEAVPRILKTLIHKQKSLFLFRRGALYRKVELRGIGVAAAVPYLIKRERFGKLKELHELMGHLGTDSVLESLKARFWWPAMQRDYRDYIRSCTVCQLHRHTDRIPQNPMYPLAPPGIPFHTWGVDFIQDLPQSQKMNTNIITAICHATKWTVSQAVPDRSTKTVAKFLFQLMLKFGAPTKIITDRASLGPYKITSTSSPFITTPLLLTTHSPMGQWSVCMVYWNPSWRR